MIRNSNGMQGVDTVPVPNSVAALAIGHDNDVRLNHAATVVPHRMHETVHSRHYVDMSLIMRCSEVVHLDKIGACIQCTSVVVAGPRDESRAEYVLRAVESDFGRSESLSGQPSPDSRRFSPVSGQPFSVPIDRQSPPGSRLPPLDNSLPPPGDCHLFTDDPNPSADNGLGLRTTVSRLGTTVRKRIPVVRNRVRVDGTRLPKGRKWNMELRDWIRQCRD